MHEPNQQPYGGASSSRSFMTSRKQGRAPERPRCLLSPIAVQAGTTSRKSEVQGCCPASAGVGAHSLKPGGPPHAQLIAFTSPMRAESAAAQIRPSRSCQQPSAGRRQRGRCLQLEASSRGTGAGSARTHAHAHAHTHILQMASYCLKLPLWPVGSIGSNDRHGDRASPPC